MVAILLGKACRLLAGRGWVGDGIKIQVAKEVLRGEASGTLSILLPLDGEQ